jgi:TM2 domain-containing membrane protein YozV
MSDPTELMMIHALNQVPENRRTEFQLGYLSRRRDRTTAFVLSFFLGYWGVDRFYLGQVGLGLGKLFTFGGLGLWWFIDLFLIMGAADEHNRRALWVLNAMYAPQLGPGYR